MKVSVISGNNDLKTMKKEISLEWYLDGNNGILPENVYYKSRELYTWKCRYCGDIFYARPCYRNVPGCKKCIRKNNGKKRHQENVKKNGLLQEKYKNIICDWDYEKNNDIGISLNDVSAGDKRVVSWVCHYCGYSWKTSISHRTSKKGTGCPACNGKVVVPGKTDIATLLPDLVQEWDAEKNVLSPEQVSGKSGRSFWWTCRYCGKSWLASPNNRQKGTNCPSCNGVNTSSKELTLFYYVKKVFPKSINRYFDENLCKELDIYIPELKTGIEYDGYFFHKEKCQKDILKNQLFYKNGIRIIRIRETSYKGEELPNIESAGCKSYTYKIKSAYNGFDNVIINVMKELGVDNDIISELHVDSYSIRLEILHEMYQGKKRESFEASKSEHIRYWDYEKNYPLLPSEINRNSHDVVFWKCPICGYSWEKSIVAEVRTSGCAKCNHQVPSDEYNFAVLFPQLLEEWDYKKNKESPFILMPYSHKKYFWVCKTCGNSFQMALCKRTLDNNGCQKCGRKNSDRKRQKIVLQIDKNTGSIIAEFPSGRIASEITGISHKGISACCNGNKKSYGGYKWELKKK